MSDLVIVNSGQVVVSSRQVAENFRKRHADVIRSIESHISDLLLTDAKVRWFYESSYTDGKGEQRKEYLMNRDGFSLPHRSRKPLALDMGMKAASSHPSCII